VSLPPGQHKGFAVPGRTEAAPRNSQNLEAERVVLLPWIRNTRWRIS